MYNSGERDRSYIRGIIVPETNKMSNDIKDTGSGHGPCIRHKSFVDDLFTYLQKET